MSANWELIYGTVRFLGKFESAYDGLIGADKSVQCERFKLPDELTARRDTNLGDVEFEQRKNNIASNLFESKHEYKRIQS